MLTSSRVILALVLIHFTLTQQWELGLICVSIAIVTNNLDGYLARRWDVRSKLGAEILQPACDMLFATTAVVLLIVIGHWPLWVGILLLAIAGVLQLISELAKRVPLDRFIYELKRHQSYIHPLYSGAVIYVAWLAYFFIEDGRSGDGTGTWYYAVIASLAMCSLGLNYKYGLQMVEDALYQPAISS